MPKSENRYLREQVTVSITTKKGLAMSDPNFIANGVLLHLPSELETQVFINEYGTLTLTQWNGIDEPTSVVITPRQAVDISKIMAGWGKGK
jgi:hypothetical protein